MTARDSITKNEPKSSIEYSESAESPLKQNLASTNNLQSAATADPSNNNTQNHQNMHINFQSEQMF
jgi:hypothetical protein